MGAADACDSQVGSGPVSPLARAFRGADAGLAGSEVSVIGARAAGPGRSGRRGRKVGRPAGWAAGGGGGPWPAGRRSRPGRRAVRRRVHGQQSGRPSPKAATGSCRGRRGDRGGDFEAGQWCAPAGRGPHRPAQASGLLMVPRRHAFSAQIVELLLGDGFRRALPVSPVPERLFMRARGWIYERLRRRWPGVRSAGPFRTFRRSAVVVVGPGSSSGTAPCFVARLGWAHRAARDARVGGRLPAVQVEGDDHPAAW